MEYPEEIYATRDGGILSPLLRSSNSTSGVGWGRHHAYNIGCAKGYQSGYEAGKAEQADPLAGYSNLTAAISAGDPIDWEKLDGKKVQCVKPEVGTLHGTLKRETSFDANLLGAWWNTGMDEGYVYTLNVAWHGENGWSLWVEGEVPLRRKTADQLDEGRCFLGKQGADFDPGISLTRQKSFLVERAYDMGKADAKNLEGFSNLTAAISAGEPIDWERLDGKRVQCVKPEVGTLHGTLERNEPRPAYYSSGWWQKGADSLYRSALIYGWTGYNGWTVYVEGEIPLRRKTADQLKPGTEFYGVLKNSEPDGVAPELMLRTQGHVLYLNDYTISQMSPRHFEVVTVVGKYGRFQKPEEGK